MSVCSIEPVSTLIIIILHVLIDRNVYVDHMCNDNELEYCINTPRLPSMSLRVSNVRGPYIVVSQRVEYHRVVASEYVDRGQLL